MKIWFPVPMVSFRRVLRKFTSFKMCGFDGSERVHARWTPLIWISLITFLTAARPVLPSVAEPRSRAHASVSRALHVECFCFRWFIWLLSFVSFCLFVWHSYLIGFSSQFLVRIKIGANMAAGWRLRLGAFVCGWVDNTGRLIFLGYFCLFCLEAPSPLNFC